jgi:hypothetical protein
MKAVSKNWDRILDADQKRPNLFMAGLSVRSLMPYFDKDF